MGKSGDPRVRRKKLDLTWFMYSVFVVGIVIVLSPFFSLPLYPTQVGKTNDQNTASLFGRLVNLREGFEQNICRCRRTATSLAWMAPSLEQSDIRSLNRTAVII